MNLLKKDPFKVFQLLFVFITLAVVLLFVYFFAHEDLETYFSEKSYPTSIEKEVSNKIYDSFGVINVAVESPSYAQSNFDVNPDTKVALYFNEEVSLESVLNNVEVTNKETGELVKFTGKKIQRKDDYTGDFLWKWQELWKDQVVLTFAKTLDPKANYNVFVKNGVKSLDESIATNNNFEFSFITADIPQLQSASIQDNLMKVIFTAPMDTEELQNKINISPSIVLENLTNNDKVLVITGNFVSGQNYTINFPLNTKDIYGRTFREDVSYSVVAE